ncbi:hypothetical protein, partial [Thauera sp. Sel9]|uniref:hypothetical protein n=1 Tax=Thauera sp. Sel9 TaxID=2974299 RepID=UPI0021E162EE
VVVLRLVLHRGPGLAGHCVDHLDVSSFWCSWASTATTQLQQAPCQYDKLISLQAVTAKTVRIPGTTSSTEHVSTEQLLHKYEHMEQSGVHAP